MSVTAQQWSDALRADSPGGGPAWLQELRRSAAEQFGQHGLPHRKDEDWKYTPMRRLDGIRPGVAAPAEKTFGFPDPILDSADFGIDVVDGLLRPAAGGLPEGVEVLSLAEGLKRHESALRAQIESTALAGSAHGFSAVNTALLEQGVVIRVAEGVDAGAGLVRWALSASGQPRMFGFRVFVALADGASLLLAEQYESPADSGSGLNIITHLEVGAGARLQHVRLQNESGNAVLITKTDVRQSGDARYAYYGFDLGGGLARHGVNISLGGRDAEAVVNGAFVLDGKRHVDNHIKVDHAAPGCASEQFFRGVLGGHSRGVFNGKALIRSGADDSRVRQSNANLLLSRNAEMDTKPELEIHADEVEASHGATVGQLDENAVFYLRSRGIRGSDARRMLTGAFCRTVSDRLAADLPEREALAGRISALLLEAMPDADGEDSDAG